MDDNRVPWYTIPLWLSRPEYWGQSQQAKNHPTKIFQQKDWISKALLRETNGKSGDGVFGAGC